MTQTDRMNELHATILLTWVVQLVGGALLVAGLVGVAVGLLAAAVGGLGIGIAVANVAAFLTFGLRLLFAEAPLPDFDD